MKFIAYVLILLSTLSISFASASVVDLSGKYDCGGAEVDTDQTFTCNMIMQKTNQTYAIKSSCSDKTAYLGAGIYDQIKHTLSIVFINPRNSKETGVIMVDVKKNKLYSTLTYLNKDTIEHGYCIKQI